MKYTIYYENKLDEKMVNFIECESFRELKKISKILKLNNLKVLQIRRR